MGRAMRARALVLALLAAAVGLAAVPAGAQSPALDVRVAMTKRGAEKIRTLPVSERHGGKRRVVLSLEPGRVGEIRSGDRLEARAEMMVTVCLKRDPDHDGPGVPCVGETYGYDPHVEMYVVLADSGDSESGKRFVGRAELVCSQHHPNRNHHCVLALPRATLRVGDAGNLPCRPARCFVNLVATAWHHDADSGEQVVVGEASSGSISQNRARLVNVRLRPGTTDKPNPITRQHRQRTRIPIAPDHTRPTRQVAYSLPLERPRAGEWVVVDGKVVAGIGHLGYNALMPAEILLTESPTATDNGTLASRVSRYEPYVALGNGFNCTQGSSAHDTPCVARKLGAIHIYRSTKKTLYLNLIVGFEAKFPSERWDPGDAAHISTSGYLRAWRYPAGSGSP
jgi:hypothetical protein